jgi:hypothetical protein
MWKTAKVIACRAEASRRSGNAVVEAKIAQRIAATTSEKVRSRIRGNRARSTADQRITGTSHRTPKAQSAPIALFE